VLHWCLKGNPSQPVDAIHDNEIGLGFLGDSQNLGIDACAERDENVRTKVGGVYPAD
jgi:hypothetical protein